jgi:type II secretory ATPase GspE/PulE/Tfp pilus assembly ATPase PilB-like protein
MVTVNAEWEIPPVQRGDGAIGRAPRGRLSDLLVKSGVVAADAVAQAMQLQDFTGKRLGTILIESGAIDEHQLAAAIAHQSGLPVVDLVESEPSLAAAAAIDGRTARANQAIPLRISAAHLDVAVANGLPLTRERLEEAAGRTVRMYVAPEMQIKVLLGLIYPEAGDAAGGKGQDLGAVAATFPVEPVNQVESVEQVEPVEPAASAPLSIAGPESEPERFIRAPARDEGWQRQICEASDVLAAVLGLALETDVDTVGIDMSVTGTKLRVKYLSGARRVLTVPSEVGERLIEAVYVAIGREQPDGPRSATGQFRPVASDADVVVRVNALPTIHGHTLTLRFVRDSTGLQDLADLGLPPETLESVERGLDFAHGLVVIAGEPGSGRSTTLRAQAG